MSDQQSDDHWRPGEPWRPRVAHEPATDSPPTEGIEVPSEPVLDVPEAAETAPAEPVTYRDAETRMFSRPPEDESAASPPSDRTVVMPAIPAAPDSPPPPPPPSGRSNMSQPPPPPPPAPTSPVERGPRRSKRRGRRFLQRLLVLVLVLAAVVALALVWVDGRLSRVDTPSVAGAGPSTYLIVGSDSRDNLPDDLEGRFGSFEGQRADVIILAQVAGGTVQMLSLPRDLKVEIPGRGTDKINAAYAYGGGDLLVRTVQTDLGIPVSHYLEVDFGGFASIVNAVGGVELTFEHPTRDLKTGLDVEAGTYEVDGSTALAYVRSRSTEELVDGDWRNADGGDIARTGRQREVLEAVVAKALNPAGLIRLPALVPAVSNAIRVGDSTHSWNLAWFGGRFALAGESESMALPVVISTEGGVSYVVRTEEAGPAIRAFDNGDPLPLPEPEE